jgi:signal transduction histidine kinase/ligand-binding sensor domain-containing protein
LRWGGLLFQARSSALMAAFHSNSTRRAKNEPRCPTLPMRIWRGRLLAGAIVLACALPAASLEPATPLANYNRQAWVMENGLPQNTVQALAQTPDGFVWAGTEMGLVRFDGSGFALFDRNSKPALPGNDVRCLLAEPDGALWVGTSEGLARVRDGAVTTWNTSNGLPGNSIRSLQQSQSGGVIVFTENGEIGIEGMRVVHFRYDKLQSPAVLFDLRLASGMHVLVDKNSVAVESAQNGHGQRWTVGKDLPGTRIQSAYADREGTFWVGTNGGLARWAGGKLQLLPVTDVLAHASVLSLMEDREGDIWVGTEADGLHILRDQRFKTYGARDGMSSDSITTVVEDGAGTLWAGTSGFGLNALQRSGDGETAVRKYSVHDGLDSDIILSLAAAANGDLWVGTPDGLSRIRGGRIDSFTSADGLPDDFIRSLLVDADGSLWVGTRHGLAHWNGSTGSPHLETFSANNGLGSDLVGAMARDSNGDLWVATLAGLSRIAGGKIVNYTTADGLSSNVITALLPRAMGNLLIGTQDNGWNVWDGQHFSRQAQSGVDQTSIHAILDDGAGHLWFATGNGIARCDSRLGVRGMTGAGCSNWIEFRTTDGLRSRETATNSHPSAWRSRDGSLWFATPKGLVEIDPAHFPVNTVPPPVAIERFAVDDADQALASHGADSWLKIPAGHAHFQFEYAGLSFVAPQKVRYRYMLDGFDRGWTEAGARRTAFYTNIPPRRYIFRVQAANNDGLWNTAGASFEFELRPHFYQTLWFYALALAAAAGLILLLLRRRLVRAEREFSAVLGERNRIAREIHDTLAQGYVGISVQLEVLAELLRLKKLDAAEKHLDTTRGYVREGLADARQSIWALRSQDSSEKTLPVRMRRLVEASGRNGFQPKFTLFGAYRPLPAETEREFLRVAQEAIHNVNRHAEASDVTVRLEYGAGKIALEVRDDGCGFEAGTEPESPPGHYGLTGMRERAAAIGGTLEVSSEPGAGTTVRLEAPAPREHKESN